MVQPAVRKPLFLPIHHLGTQLDAVVTDENPRRPLNQWPCLSVFFAAERTIGILRSDSFGAALNASHANGYAVRALYKRYCLVLLATERAGGLVHAAILLVSWCSRPVSALLAVTTKT
jgi:hypothetical protein